jgi:hypothetical protein
MRLKTLARTAAVTAATAFLYRRFLRQPILTWGAAPDGAAEVRLRSLANTAPASCFS